MNTGWCNIDEKTVLMTPDSHLTEILLAPGMPINHGSPLARETL